VADTSRWVLVNVITSRLVPPAVIVEGVNVLLTVGRLGVMLSVSATVHVPVAQDGLVFVTPEGTEIVAVLTTWVCAEAVSWKKKRMSNANRTRISIPGALFPNSVSPRG
jgi:hypothetical protein